MQYMSNSNFTCKAILVAIEKIDNYSKEFKNSDDFYHHELNFDATMMQFVIIREMITKLNLNFMEEHTNIPWQDIKDWKVYIKENSK